MGNSRTDRRRKPDLLQRSFLWLSLTCWGLFWLAVMAFHYARPEVEYGLLRYWNIDIRTTWDPGTLQVFLTALWSCLAITSVSILLILPRNRRLEDYHIYYFAFLLTIAIASLVAYYIAR